MSDAADRAALEAIAFGRGDATDDERGAASDELARRWPASRAQPVAVDEPATTSQVSTPALDEPAVPEAEDEALDEQEADTPTAWRHRAVIAVVAIAALVLVGFGYRILVQGWQPFAPVDSLTIFDRPQTDRDLEFPSSILDSAAAEESIRLAGSTDEYDVYLYRVESDALGLLVCMVVVQDGDGVGGNCGPADQFSDGGTARITRDGVATEVSWDLAGGVTAVSASLPPLPAPLSVFDRDQDDADRNALLYLPEVPEAAHDSVRYLGNSGGYYLAAYRSDADGVCLAVYDGTTTVATTEVSCVEEEVFERDGIALLYPGDDPAVMVRWGPGPSFSVSGR